MAHPILRSFLASGHIKSITMLPLVALIMMPECALAQNDSDSAPIASSGRGEGRKKIAFTPYLEASQIATHEFSPDNETLTYSAIAAGVDANVAGRRSGASMSLRYERRFGWGKNVEDHNNVSGLARGYFAVSRGVQIEAGGMASRFRRNGSGELSQGPIGFNDQVTQVYSGYVGPTVSTRVGVVDVNAGYQLGYTRTDLPDAPSLTPGADANLFDESVSQKGNLRLAVKPGDVLPVGLEVRGSYNRENMNNLDQRLEDMDARAQVTVPITNSLSAIGAVGHERTKASNRQALLDGDGKPVLASNGRYETDKSSPRRISYDVSGLIWDAGVIYRPSSRMRLELTVGRRYGSRSYNGSLDYAPSRRSSINVSIYDRMGGFGGNLNRALSGLPTDFEVIRDPITGNISGCVGAQSGGTCIANALSSARSGVSRNRGGSAAYNVDLGRISFGVGVGYDNRRYIGASGTVLDVSNGLTEETIWVSGHMMARLDQSSSISGQVRGSWFHSGLTEGGDNTGIGATINYTRNITPRLSARATLGIDGTMYDTFVEDYWTASALVGLRYSF